MLLCSIEAYIIRTASQYSNKQLVRALEFGQDVEQHLNVLGMALEFNVNVLVVVGQGG